MAPGRPRPLGGFAFGLGRAVNRVGSHAHIFSGMAEISEPTDLFGLPRLEQPERRGRRKLVFAPEAYERVEVLAAGGMSQEEIAAALRISVPTLTKYFGKELQEAVARRRAEALQLLAASARKGNVGAQKAWLQRLDQQGAAKAMRDRERTPQRIEPAVGKKEARQQAASKIASAGSKYAPPPAPRLAVDNT